MVLLETALPSIQIIISLPICCWMSNSFVFAPHPTRAHRPFHHPDDCHSSWSLAVCVDCCFHPSIALRPYWYWGKSWWNAVLSMKLVKYTKWISVDPGQRFSIIHTFQYLPGRLRIAPTPHVLLLYFINIIEHRWVRFLVLLLPWFDCTGLFDKIK